jgi:hypothetical protein
LSGLGWIVVIVLTWEGGESLPCAIIRLDNCYSFPSWKGESLQVSLDNWYSSCLGREREFTVCHNYG